MHQKCFDKFESLAVLFLSKHARCRDWSYNQKLSSLWMTRARGYDLIFKICACECGHGHIRRDMAFAEAVQEGLEGAVVFQTDQEKKKRRKSEVKPKLNYPQNKVSEKSVGSFNYNKQSKSNKSRKPILDDNDADDFVDGSSIPGLKPSQTPLMLDLDLSVLGKINKKTPFSMMRSIGEENGWKTVSKNLGRRENKPSDIDAIGTSVEQNTEEDSMMPSEEPEEVYQSDDDMFENLSDNVFLGYRGDIADASSGGKNVLLEVLYEDLVFGTKEMKTRVVGNEQLEEMLGNLLEEKLVEEISKKKALEEVHSLVEHNQSIRNAFLTEREKLEQNIHFLHQSNMELREVSQAREVVLQMQIEELRTALDEEVQTKNAVLKENDYLNRLVQCVEIDQAKSVAAIEVDRKDCMKQIAEAANIVKAHDNAALQMLAKEKMKMMTSVNVMEERIESLIHTVETLREKIENILMENLLTEENLMTEKKLVRNLREQLETVRESGVQNILELVLEVLKSSTRSDLSSTIFNQILKKVEVAKVNNLVRECCQDVQRFAFASQLTLSSEEINSREGSLLLEMLETDREEARQTRSKVEMLEGTVKTLQWKHMLIERKLAGFGDKRLDGLKDKVLELVKYCDQFEEMSNKMAFDQDIAHQQFEDLNSGLDQQILDNKSLGGDFPTLEKRMGALEDES